MAAEQQNEPLSDEQLVHDLLQAERDLVGLRFQHSMSTLENTAELAVARKQIARFRTEARQREIAQGLPKNGLIQQHGKSFRSTAAPSAEAHESGGFLAGIVDKLTGKE